MNRLRLWLAKGVFARRRARIYNSLAYAFEHDATPVDEITTRYSRAAERGSPIAVVYEQWAIAMQRRTNGSLARAMEGTVPDADFALLVSAEENNTQKSQSLARGLRFLARSVEGIETMRRSLIKVGLSMVVPLAMLLGLMVGMDTYLFPLLDDNAPRTTWLPITRIAANIVHHAASASLVMMVIAPVLIYLWLYSLPRWTGQGRRFAEKTPFYSKYRNYQCAIFLFNLAFQMGTGRQIKDALERICQHAQPWMRKRHVEPMIVGLTRYSNAGDALVSTGLFAGEGLQDLIPDYARWGGWHENLEEISQDSMQIVLEDLQSIGPFVRNTLILFVGAVLIFTVGSAMATMMKTAISGSAGIH